MANISVSLPDGSQREMQDGATAADLASDIGKGLLKAALIAEVNGEETDLNKVLPNGAIVNIVTADSDKGLETLRHSTAHVLAQAVLELYPGATFAIGPPIEHGFYYDFAMPEGEKLSDESLQVIEEKMKEIITADQDLFEGRSQRVKLLRCFLTIHINVKLLKLLIRQK